MRKVIYTVVVLLSMALNLQAQFNYYYGNIHSQSSYSDGNKDSATSLITTPLQDFNYANQSQQIDFYGISDHNHLSAGMTTPAHFHMGVADANSANNDGTFVALYGQEWGVITGGGHAIVYGMDSLMGWDAGDYDIFVAQNDYATLWNKVNARPGTFAYLAHPAQTDYTNLFTTALNATADNAIVGMAARSGPAFSTNNTYSNPSTSDYTIRYKEALSLGYHLGVGLDHDSHNSVFGRQTAGRLVIEAPALTRYNVLDAMRKMRFYSSDDWNVKVNFSINTQPMGSVYTHSGTPTINVTITDPNAENTASINVYYGVPGSGSLPTILTTAVNTNTLSYNHAIVNGSSYYYYLEITQTDGDVIWTSPIWYKRNDLVIANPPVTNFSISTSNHCVGQAIALTDLTTNAPNNWSWTMIGATTNSSVLQNPTVTYTAAGTYSIVLIALNGTGTGLPVTKTITIGNPVTLTVTATSNTLCAGNTVTLAASGASTYTWNTGALTSATAVSPSVTTAYTVIGTTGGCTANKTTTLTVSNSPTVSVNSASICSGGAGVNLTATGASTYSWNTGAVSNSISVSPAATTVYTVTGNTGGCSTVKTATVSVITSPTIVVNSATVCSGNSATLTASGATSYSWNTGALTNTITSAPAATTIYTVTGINGGCSSTKTSTVMVSASPTLAVNATTICSGNTTTITANGATTYTWNTGAVTNTISVSPLITTQYTVTGTGAGCSSIKTTTVTVNATPTVNVNAVTICSGNAATLTASGATNYSWSTGAMTNSITVSPAATTIYTVSGSSNGCNNSITTTVTVSTSLTVVVNTATMCSGNNTILTASGASTYSWNTGAVTSSIAVSPAVTSTYTVTGASGTCNNTKTTTVTVNTTPTVSVSSNTTNVCAGQSVSLSASGANSYLWSTGAGSFSITATPSVTTNYSVTGTSVNGCTNTAGSNIIVNGLPTIGTSSSASMICNGQTSTLTANGANSYTWSTGTVSNTIVVSPASNTTYSVTGTGANGCSNSATITQSVSICTGLTTLKGKAEEIKIFPNPNFGEFVISLNEEAGNAIVEVYNSIGERVYSMQLHPGDNIINLKGVCMGIYEVRIISNSLIIKRERIIRL